MPPLALSVLHKFSASVTLVAGEPPCFLGRVAENFKADKAAAEKTLACFKGCVSSQSEALSECLSLISEIKGRAVGVYKVPKDISVFLPLSGPTGLYRNAPTSPGRAPFCG